MFYERGYLTDLSVIPGLIKIQHEPQKNHFSLPKFSKMATSVATTKRSLRIKYVILATL